MSNGYWKLVEKADGWDTHKDKYEWVEEKEDRDRYSYSRDKTKPVGTGNYMYKKSKPYGR